MPLVLKVFMFSSDCSVGLPRFWIPKTKLHACCMT
uniref:Uncharacterized protein n=1 Tax=Arundo donax TaxID=35708 RepID=A0A0A9G2K9_ARUDO